MEAPDPEDQRQPVLARRNPWTSVPKLCPRCLSQLEAGGRFGGWLFPQSYYCSKCGYSGTVFLEREGDSGRANRE